MTSTDSHHDQSPRASQRQVAVEHYEYARYVDQKRWSSLWHQLDEAVRRQPSALLEIGPGPGLFKVLATRLGLKVITLDMDPALQPDYVASVLDMPFEDGSIPLVCAFQVLEHLPFEQSLAAFADMVRVSARDIIISLPDARPVYPISISLPRCKPRQWLLPSPRVWALEHVFDGEHYWEINKRGYALSYVVECLLAQGPLTLATTYRVHANPYHRFLCFSKHSG